MNFSYKCSQICVYDTKLILTLSMPAVQGKRTVITKCTSNFSVLNAPYYIKMTYLKNYWFDFEKSYNILKVIDWDCEFKARGSEATE